MPSRSLPRRLTLASALLFSILAPALAATPNAALLQSYAGNYTGRGALLDGSTRETIRCRLTLQPSGAARLTYAGRCSTGGASFSMSGIISYDSGRRAYVAAMSSSTANFSATVTGRRSGGDLVFAARQAVTYQGRLQTVSSTMALTSGGIRIDFSAADPKTGRTTSGSVPFSRIAP